jgi:hypothetical protein
MTTQTSINKRPPGAAPPPPTVKGWCEAAPDSDPDRWLRAGFDRAADRRWSCRGDATLVAAAPAQNGRI